MDNNRRQHRRLNIRLPVECYPATLDRQHAVRTVTNNISTGGLYFEVDLIDGVSEPTPQSLLHVELTVPPGDGHFPYEGRLNSVAEVIRCDRLGTFQNPELPTHERLGVAARFREPLKLLF